MNMIYRYIINFYFYFQVLPNRTHPEIQMNNYSGYILSCILTKKLRESW